MPQERKPSEANAGDDRRTSFSGLAPQAWEYAIDAAQRWVLFWDVLRERGNAYHEHLAETAPHVLNFSVELIQDGTLPPQEPWLSMPNTGKW